jgi:hypothetical protein
MAIFQVYFMAGLAWSASRFLGPGYASSPEIEKRSRAYMAAGAAAMLFFVLIDLLQALTLKVRTELASGLQFIPMILIGWAVLIKRKYVIAPSVIDPKGSRSMGHGVRLKPGRIYLELSDRSSGEGMSASEVLRSQVRQGRPVMLVTDKEPKRYRLVPKLHDIPLVHFMPMDAEGTDGSDLTSEEVLDTVGLMAKEFALEAWMQDPSKDKDRGAVVIIEGLAILNKTAGRHGIRTFLKTLREDVRGSDQLCIILLGDTTDLSGISKILKKYTRRLGSGKSRVRSNR